MPSETNTTNTDNNLVSKRMSDGSLEEKYLYNKDGSLLAAINSSGIETFEYTFNGYIKNKSRNGRNILSYEYNKNGSVEAVVDQTGARTEYIYDTLGRMQTVKDGTQEIASYNYNVDNTISQVNYNTGINISYQYDRDKNIENLTSKDPQNNIIKELEYSYYNNGNVKTKIENGNTTAYTYDKADRLKIENNPTAGLIVYSYDNAHNMLSKKVGEDETTYSYDVNNRLIQSTNNGVITDYTYDNNGNLLSEEKGTEYTNYIYDGFNKLKEVNKLNGSWMYNEYSALGLRIATEENGVRAEFAFDRGSILTEVDSNNELIARSIRGLGLVAQKDNRGVLSYYLHNAHGDVTNLVDENGQVLNSYEYDAFGNTLNHAEKVANRFMYAGEQFDKVTGQYYLRARYYAPNIARFTQEDTYRGDGLNLYGYVSNNPVRYVDPSGHCKDGVGSVEKSETAEWQNRWKERINGFNEGLSKTFRNVAEEAVYSIKHPIETSKNVVEGIRFLSPKNPNVIQNQRMIIDTISNEIGYINQIFTGNNYREQGRIIGSATASTIIAYQSIKANKNIGIEDTDEIVEEIVENSVEKTVKETFEEMSKSGEQLTSLYRAVGPDEFYDLMENGTFNVIPNGLQAKQFGLNFEQTLKYADSFSDYGAIIEVKVPTHLLDDLADYTPVDRFIFKDGTVTITGDKLSQFNKVIQDLTHKY